MTKIRLIQMKGSNYVYNKHDETYFVRFKGASL